MDNRSEAECTNIWLWFGVCLFILFAFPKAAWVEDFSFVVILVNCVVNLSTIIKSSGSPKVTNQFLMYPSCLLRI